MTLNLILSHICKLSGGNSFCGRSDAELLGEYARTHDERVFEELLRRHGRMVWNVCTRQAPDQHAAEDVFQATFLALARHAGRIRQPAAIAAWLHGVAVRLAARQTNRVSRATNGSPPAEPLTTAGDDPVTAREVFSLVNVEVNALAERLRGPVVLCYFEGKTRDQAARDLGLSVATLKRRLETARNLLRERLARRGVALPVFLGLLFEAEVPARAVADTMRAAAGGPVAPAVAALVAAVAPGFRPFAWVLGLVAVAAGLSVAALPTTTPPQPTAGLSPRHDAFGDPLPDGAVLRVGTVRLRHGVWGWGGDAAFLPARGAVASVHGTRDVCLWDATTGAERERLEGPEGAVSLSATPDGAALVVGGTREVWAVELTPAAAFPLWKYRLPPGHELYPAYCVAVSPDGRFVAVATGGHPVAVLDAGSGAVLRELSGAAQKVVFSPDGSVLAACGRWSGVALWDAATGTPRGRLGGPDAVVWSLAFAPDGRSLAVAGSSGVGVWDLATQAEVWRREPAAPEPFVSFSPDGRTLLECGGEAIRFRAAADGRERRVAVRAEGLSPVQVLPVIAGRRMSPDGRLVAAVADGAVGLWEADTGRPVGPAGGPRGPVTGVAFSGDGATLATVSRLRQLHLTPLDATAAEREVRVDRPGLLATDVCASDRAGRFDLFQRSTTAAGGWALTRHDARGAGSEELPVAAHLPPPSAARPYAASADGRWQAWGATDGVVIAERASGREVARIPECPAASYLAFSADGQSVLAYSPGRHGLGVWASETGQKRFWLETAFTQNNPDRPPLALSADGRWVAAVERADAGGFRLRSWEVASWAPAVTFDVAVDERTVLAFAPDGRLAAAGRDGVVRLFDPETGRAGATYRGHRGPALALAFDRDGRRLASGSADGTALVWAVPERSPPPGAPGAGARALVEVLATAAPAPAARAANQLCAAPGTAAPALRERLVSRPVPSVEDAERPAARLAKLDGPARGRRLEAVRCVAALERLAATPAALQLLRDLARGPDHDPAAAEARAALRRLAQPGD
ncbi:sigma-70 family RNA polymerase sigma factor [Gemmata sp. JC717]|uniref:sigma-70 family RNA polymerase sigma factor n=1 Tax=Gemmata algarum TaxID=2975278 RepID=UPI0021BA559C|nr:sigma-70 family RNA polymerase sigma factor [Gemmata algarum]MDY3555884.1 sigma-70 family RNA polymerase sigma factor [Gemmata algarum]